MRITKPLIGSVVGAATIAAAITIGAASTANAQGGAEHATATIIDSSGTTIGFATFVEDGRGSVHVNVKVEGLSSGRHGIHVHEAGSCGSTTGTFSDALSHHRSPGTIHPDHHGDLPNLEVNRAGRGHLEVTTNGFTLSTGAATVFDGNGSALVIHALEDRFDAVNFGGPRIACGVIVAR